jgi:arginine/serine-rich splicing factor 1/9
MPPPPPPSQVIREGGEPIGYVDYVTREDMERAIRRLDDSEFRNPFDKALVRVKEIGR